MYSENETGLTFTYKTLNESHTDTFAELVILEL